jgi:hypothetical protein
MTTGPLTPGLLPAVPALEAGFFATVFQPLSGPVPCPKYPAVSSYSMTRMEIHHQGPLFLLHVPSLAGMPLFVTIGNPHCSIHRQPDGDPVPFELRW